MASNQPFDPTSKTALAAAERRFQQSTEDAKRRLIMSIYAKPKSGKTHFSLTAPGPIGYIAIDMGDEGVVQKFHKDKKIFKSDYRLKIPPKGSDMNLVSAQSVAMWDDMHSDLYYSLTKHRTTVIDTADEAWGVLRLARFGKLDQVKPHHYGPVNAEFRDLFRECYDHDGNVIMIHKAKSEYIDDRKTGKLERAGFSETGFLTQVELYMWREEIEDRDDASDNGFRAKIISCRQNAEIEGEVLQGEMLNFPMLAMMVFPDSDESDWT